MNFPRFLAVVFLIYGFITSQAQSSDTRAKHYPILERILSDWKRPDLCSLNLLKNPDLADGLDAWYGGGELYELPTGEPVALKSCQTFEAAFQTVKASPGELYTLRVFAKKEHGTNGSIAIKFLNDEFVPIEQHFLTIESETYQLLERTEAAPIGSAFVEVNVFQDEGEGCVFAKNWCLSQGKKGEKGCSTTEYQLSLLKKEQTISTARADKKSRQLMVLSALAQHPAVLDLWKGKTAAHLEKHSAVYSAFWRYVFE